VLQDLIVVRNSKRGTIGAFIYVLVHVLDSVYSTAHLHIDVSPVLEEHLRAIWDNPSVVEQDSAALAGDGNGPPVVAALVFWVPILVYNSNGTVRTWKPLRATPRQSVRLCNHTRGSRVVLATRTMYHKRPHKVSKEAVGILSGRRNLRAYKAIDVFSCGERLAVIWGQEQEEVYVWEAALLVLNGVYVTEMGAETAAPDVSE